MTLCSDVEQTKVAINDRMIEKARLAPLFTRAIASPDDTVANVTGDRAWLVRYRLLNKGTHTVAERVTHMA